LQHLCVLHSPENLEITPLVNGIQPLIDVTTWHEAIDIPDDLKAMCTGLVLHLAQKLIVRRYLSLSNTQFNH